MASDDQNDNLTASEAVFGILAWLTSRKEKTVLSATDLATPAADAAAEFIKANNLSEPRDGWEQNLVHPKGGEKTDGE